MSKLRLEPIGPAYQQQESVTVSSISKALTAATYKNHNTALITCEDATVRFWLSGTAPTASEGHILKADGELQLNSFDQIANVRFIRKGGADATLRVSYGGGRPS